MAYRVCISGYYGFGNFGDELILEILIKNLKSFNKKMEITVFAADAAAERYENIVKTFNFIDVIRAVKRSDCLISGGGGLLQDSSSAASFLYYLFVIGSALAFKKKVIIFAQGIGPVKNKFLKKLMLMMLKHADYITVRDKNSLKLLIENGIKKAQLCCDPVWNAAIPECIKQNRIGVQLRSCKIISDNFITRLAENINKYYSDKEIYILSLQNSFDLDVCEKFKSRLKTLNSSIKAEVIKNTSNEKVLQDISSCLKLISMRYHACLIGIKAGVKVLPVSYDIKVKALAEEFDLDFINDENEMDALFERFEKFGGSEYNKEKIPQLKYDFAGLEEVMI